MIITQFKGRLGNQLFQYAAARKLAILGKTDLKLDLRNYANEPDAHRIRFFNIDETVATEKESEGLKKKDLRYYLEKFLPYYKRRFVWERNWNFDKNLIGLKRKNMYIRGQFSSPKYFEGIEDLIRAEYTLKKPLDAKHDVVIKEMAETNSVSVHVRRGDITQGELANERPTSQADYYKHAIELISNKIPAPHFFIFSDDIVWAKENLNFIKPSTFVSQKGMQDYEELVLMSNCKHNIIGNSSFSWWGAWLNANPEKIVIAPKNWLVNKKENEEYIEHLIPKSWITL
jgi:hypothetical protein